MNWKCFPCSFPSTSGNLSFHTLRWFTIRTTIPAGLLLWEESVRLRLPNTSLNQFWTSNINHSREVGTDEYHHTAIHQMIRAVDHMKLLLRLAAWEWRSLGARCRGFFCRLCLIDEGRARGDPTKAHVWKKSESFWVISWCRLFGCCFVLDVFRDLHVWRWSIFLFGEWRGRAYPYSTYLLWGWDIYVYILICILYIPFLFTPCVDGQYCLVVGAACLVWNKGNLRWGTKKDEPLFHNVLSLFWNIKTKLGRNNQPQTGYLAFPGGSLDFIQHPKDHNSTF